MMSGKCSVTIAGGLVEGEYTQVKAVQKLISESEQLHSIVDELFEQVSHVLTFRDGTDNYERAVARIENLNETYKELLR